jgi:hypothetical protein
MPIVQHCIFEVHPKAWAVYKCWSKHSKQSLAGLHDVHNHVTNAAQVRSNPAMLQHHWQLSTYPPPMRFAVEHGVAMTQPSALKPALTAKRALERLLQLRRSEGEEQADPASAGLVPAALSEVAAASAPASTPHDHPLTRRSRHSSVADAMVRKPCLLLPALAAGAR